MTDKYLIEIYEKAEQFLEKTVGRKILDSQLNPYLDKKPQNLEQIFKRMVQSLKNKSGHKNFIANIGEMENILLDFNSSKVLKHYDEWQKLFLIFQDKYVLKYKMDITNKKNAWVMFSKGVLSCATFLSKFKNFQEFDKFICSFSGNSYKIAALPMLIGTEIYGYGFALACDFLKEVGYTDYGKPDVHIKDIFIHYGLIHERSDYEAFKMIAEIGIAVEKPPVIVDKIFWLIGSGNFHFSKITKGRLKDKFYNYYKVTK